MKKAIIESLFILLVCLPTIVTADQKGENMIPNEDQSATFYNNFLNAELYIPTNTIPENEERKRAGEDDTFSPIILEHDGVKHLMLFDSKEKLRAWAKRGIGFVGFPGHVVVEMMSTEFHWALNAGTEDIKIFTPDEIQWLKDTVAQAKAKEIKISTDTKVLISEPASPPQELIESLRNVLVRNREVKRAFLGQVLYAMEGESLHLTLVLETDNRHPPTTIEAISDDLGLVAQRFLAESEYFDIMFQNDSEVAKTIVDTIQPFYISARVTR